jgi:hypothetical protein
MSYQPIDTSYSDKDFKGNIRFTGTITVPSGSISASDIDTSTPFVGSATQHQFPVWFSTITGAAATTSSEVIYIAKESATVIAFDAAADVAPTSSDTVTIDLQLSTAGGAFATVLASPIVLDNTSVDRVAEPASLSGSPALVAGDLLRIDLTVSGTTAQGVIARAKINENPT